MLGEAMPPFGTNDDPEDPEALARRLAILAHRLRNPLGAIVGWAHMLGQGDLDEGARVRAVDAILRSAAELARLIDTIEPEERPAVEAPLEPAEQPSSREAVIRDERARLGPDPRLDGIRVLVVDDDAGAREMVEVALQQYGAAVSSAAGAAEALDAFDHSQPEVVVADLEMPHMDGYTFIRAIRSRALDEGGATPALALTAHGRAAHRLKALRAGFQFHLSKPVEPYELAMVIASLVKRR
jgi:CheY-like chemotaxis protein